jgi:nucleoside-diphosphate-sugar epimerase
VLQSREGGGRSSSVLLFGTGQIGVFAARALTQRGLRVWAADAAPDAAFYARFGPGAHAAPPVELDVTLANDVETFVRSYPESEAVVFAAGFTGARATADPVTARLVAERGIANVLTAARASGIKRAVVVSSLAIYGDHGAGDRLSVDAPATQPGTAYGQIQLALEKCARTFFADLNVAILRIAGVFGPKRFGYGSNSSRFIERMLFSAAIGSPVHIEGFWEDEDDLIYVKDVGAAIAAAALCPDTGSFTVNVGLGRVSTLREIADSVLAVFPAANISVTPPLQMTAPHTRPPLDCASIMARLGVRPAFPLMAAIRDYALETGLIDAG